jgi:D-amino-acid dehydrogenase
MTVPLPEPGLLREGLRGLADRWSPLAVDPRLSPYTAAFLADFVRNATTPRWRQGLGSLSPLAQASLAAYDEMIDGGVDIRCHEAAVRVGFQEGEDPAGLRHELDSVSAAGMKVEYLDAAPEAPFSSRIARMMIIEGQRYVDPGQTLGALTDAIRAAGGRIAEGTPVRSVGFGPQGLQVETWVGPALAADAVVPATGSWLPELAAAVGISVRVQAGRGYSCTVPMRQPLTTPLYLPGARVAITPYRDGARLAGIMEITHRDAPFRMARLEAVRRSVQPLLDGADWSEIRDPWVGPRPLTPDGLPIVGATRMPGVHVAGGHGMWGLTLGPVTGKLLAEQITTGASVPQLAPLDPCRSAVRQRRSR